MRIIHFCLSCFFIDGQLYQENELVRQHVDEGNEVLVVASTDIFDSLGYTTYCNPASYVGDEGAQVIRLPYRRWLPHPVGKRIRSFPGVREILADFSPDAIIFHGSSAWELLTVSRYVRDNPRVIFHIDSHADAVNSGRGWLSRSLLHRHFYGPILRQAMHWSGPLLCVSTSVMDFARDVYGVPAERLEFYPLGGRISDKERRSRLRTQTRDQLGLPEEAILIVQSGKQNRLKKLPRSLRALASVPNPDLRLVVAGVLQEDIREECEALIAADPRVTFLGWQEADSLTALLCAADVYLQPGTQSATMQHSLCCGCAVILDRIPAHQPYIEGNGWLITSEIELRDTLHLLPACNLGALCDASLYLALEMLDYSKLARRVLK